MNRTAIGWTDYTWNPASGCEVIGPECKFCYAEALAEQKRGTAGFPNGFDLTLRPHRLDQPRALADRLRKARVLGVRCPTCSAASGESCVALAPHIHPIRPPHPRRVTASASDRPLARVFVNSMTDLFWDRMPEAYVDQCVEAMAATPDLAFQLLTKRAGRMLDYFNRRPSGVPDNVWCGVTCGHSSRLDEVELLRRIPAAVRFVSAEPLLDPLDALDLSGIDWLIVGGESGRHLASNLPDRLSRALVERGPGGRGWIAREDRIPWVRRLVAEGERIGVPVYFKQWGGTRPDDGGRDLDGRTHDGMPVAWGAP